ncbi:MAG: bifunctional 5,10-methylenetetrahydrofolate dehydrogenase/5,10-methenyltetrahydrofolate cyclohydrolase, partial [Anaerolineae bacterium]
PALAAMLVGDDPANVAYARMKARWADKAGIGFHCFALAADAGTEAVCQRIAALNADPDIDGVLVEMPLPDGYDAEAVRAAISPQRDVEGVTATSLGCLVAGAHGPRPATALAIMALLDEAGTPLEGKRATVVGRSVVVGKPTALLLLARHATVTIAHSRTRDLAAVTREADVLVTATGVPDLIRREHVKPGAVVIDAGTTPVGDGDSARLAGDTAFEEVVAVASAITPVPGGVGPVTTALLLANAVALVP